MSARGVKAAPPHRPFGLACVLLLLPLLGAASSLTGCSPVAQRSPGDGATGLPAEGGARLGEPLPPPPAWLRTSPIHESIDADQLLRREENPLARVEMLLRTMEPGSVVLVYSTFIPEPLLQRVESRGAEVYVVAKTSGQFETYIRKKA